MHLSDSSDGPGTHDSFVPVARSAGILESRLGDEMVLYDVDHDRAHALNPSALALWRACDGTADVTELARRLTADGDVVYFGLTELDRRGLLESPLPSHVDPRRIGRREMLKKVAVGGAVGLAVPTILSVIAADPAAAVTCRTAGQTCTGGASSCTNAAAGDCCAGLRCCGGGTRICQ